MELRSAKRLITFAVLSLAALGTVLAGITLAEPSDDLVNLALGKPYTVTILERNEAMDKYEAAYPDTDGKELTDGVVAPKVNFYDPAWVGYLRQGGREVLIDLGAVVSISKVRVRFLAYKDAGISLPEIAEVSFSEDGQAFGEPVTLLPTEDETQAQAIVPFAAEFTGVRARYVKIAWSTNVWVFVDEIEVLGPKGQ